jgi:hypothetical protein
VKTRIATTDGPKALLMTGRGVKAVIQWRKKTLAAIHQAPSRTTTGACRWRRRQRRHERVLDPTKRQVREATHKATHAIAAALPGATCEVGEPFTEAAQGPGRLQAQPVSTAGSRTRIQPRDAKTVGAIPLSEASSSRTGPVCGERSPPHKIDQCSPGGATGPRDGVGAGPILRLGRHGALRPGRPLPPQGT